MNLEYLIFAAACALVPLFSGCAMLKDPGNSGTFKPEFAFVLRYGRYENGTYVMSGAHKVALIKDKEAVRTLALFFPKLGDGGKPLFLVNPTTGEKIPANAGWGAQIVIWFLAKDGGSVEVESWFESDVCRIRGRDCERKPGFERHVRQLFPGE